MRRLSPILVSASSAFHAVFVVAFCLAFAAQPIVAASGRAQKHGSAKSHAASHPVASRTAAKSAASAHGRANSAIRGKLKAASQSRTGKHSRQSAPVHNVSQVHGAGLPRYAHSAPALLHVRGGALRAARRRAHAYDATPRSLQRVRLAMPAPLFGSHESLVRQNDMAQADGLERILDDDDLNDRITHGSLVPVPVTSSLRINTDLPENRRYCRPWTAKFLTDLAHAHTGKFANTSLEVTSAVRTVEFQRRLRYTNGNAAAADGDIASPHLTGGTIDIAKQGLTSREIAWLRTWLIPLEQQGKIDVEEEFRQSCFHISVYKSYLTQTALPTDGKPAVPLASGTMLAVRGR